VSAKEEQIVAMRKKLVQEARDALMEEETHCDALRDDLKLQRLAVREEAVRKQHEMSLALVKRQAEAELKSIERQVLPFVRLAFLFGFTHQNEKPSSIHLHQYFLYSHSTYVRPICD
jgi:hypothetical protein